MTWVPLICSDRVQSLCYLQLTRQLVSCSADGGIAVWNMDVSREEVRSKSLVGGQEGGQFQRRAHFVFSVFQLAGWKVAER